MEQEKGSTVRKSIGIWIALAGMACLANGEEELANQPGMEPQQAVAAVETAPGTQGGSANFERCLEQGRAAQAQEQWAEAAEAFRQALALAPQDEEAAFGLATALTNMERYGDAKPLLEGLLKKMPDSAFVKNNLAWVYARASDPQVRNPALAVKLARDALLAMPAEFNVWNTLAEAYYAAGNYARAERVARQALELGLMAGLTNEAPLREMVERCRAAAAAAEGAEKTDR